MRRWSQGTHVPLKAVSRQDGTVVGLRVSGSHLNVTETLSLVKASVD